MPSNFKKTIAISLSIGLIFALCVWYHFYVINKAEYSETDSILAQAGQLVTIHKVLSRENEDYKHRQLIWLLANEADEKLRANHDKILKHMPPNNLDAYHTMANELHDLAGGAPPAQTDQKK